MQRELSIAVASGLGGMVGWGVADFFAKKTIDAIGDVPALFWSQCLGIVPLAILFLTAPENPGFKSTDYLYLPILGIWSGLSYIPTYVAFGKGKVSLLSPIFAAYAVVVTVLSALFFRESIPFGRQVAFSVVFVGVLLVNGDLNAMWTLARGERTERRESVKGLKEILLAVALYSLWLIALDQFISGRYWVPFLLVIRIFSAASLWVYAKATRRKLHVQEPKLWMLLMLVGFFDVIAFGFVSYGFSATPHVSIIAMLSGAFSLPTIVLARVFLRERTAMTQTVGSVVVIVGIMLLAVL